MKILFATDGSDCSKVALEKLSEWLLEIENLDIHVISVTDTMHQGYVGPFGVINEYYTEIADEARRSAEQAVFHAMEVLKNKNPQIQIKPIRYEGDPKKIILETAEALDTDLIVLGSHGYGTLNRLILGSVSHAVALHAPCSVMIVREADNDK